MKDDYERLIRPLEKRLVRTIWRIVQDEDEAEDALQETFEKIWRRLDEVRRHPNSQALILRIAINTSYDALRRRSRRQTIARADSLPDPAPALDRVQADENHAEVRLALGRLSRIQAEALLLRFADESSYAAIAAVLGCSESTARTDVERGRRRLKTILAHLKC